MRYLLVVIVALVALAAAEDDWKPEDALANQKEIEKRCEIESGLLEEQITKMRNNQHPDEKEVRDYVHCCVKKMGTFTDDGGYNVDRIMQILALLQVDVEKAREIVTECVKSNEEKSSPEAWAFRDISCMMSNKLGDLIKEAQLKVQSETRNKV